MCKDSGQKKKKISSGLIYFTSPTHSMTNYFLSTRCVNYKKSFHFTNLLTASVKITIFYVLGSFPGGGAVLPIPGIRGCAILEGEF